MLLRCLKKNHINDTQDCIWYFRFNPQWYQIFKVVQHFLDQNRPKLKFDETKNLDWNASKKTSTPFVTTTPGTQTLDIHILTLNHPMYHLTSPIERFRSQPSVTFFPSSVRSLHGPKRSILFFIFWQFFGPP